MEKTYPILLGGQTVGKAAVRREGLYLLFVCDCRFSGQMLYKITVQCGEHREELGVPVPADGSFHLQTRRPAKRFEKGELSFRAMPKHSALNGKFVPLSPDEPFAYLNRLQDAYLEVRGGQVGLVIPGQEI